MVMLKSKAFLRTYVFLLAVFVGGMCVGSPTFALIESRYNRYAQNSIYFYDPDCIAAFGEGGGGGGAGRGGGTLIGRTRAEKIWNYIVGLNRTGISDNAEVIAGVLGNMSVETGGTFNPFIQSRSGYTGLIQWSPIYSPGFYSYMKNKGLNKYYYRGSSPNIDESIIDRGIYAELDFLFKDGSNGNTADSYMANLSVPTKKRGVDGARAYADLFLVTVENAFGGSDTIEDPGVRSFASYSRYQAAAARRTAAANIYNQYKDTVSDETPIEEDEEEDGDTPEYCDYGSDDDDNDEGRDEPKAGNLASFVKAWAWSKYRRGYTIRKEEYKNYIDNKATYKGACNGNDCGAFVANIIKASGWDTSYPQCNTGCQNSWLPDHWKKVDVGSLKLGDVGIRYDSRTNKGHVILYVGNIEGFESNTASASQCDRAPMAGSKNENLNQYDWYRKK